MEKKIILGVTSLCVLAITLLLMLPEERADTPDTLPWHITHPTPDTARIFGITLGETTLAEAEKQLKEETQIAMFKSGDDKKSIEGYIEEVNFNGLKAKMIFTITLSPAETEGMYTRGQGIANSPSGKRIRLTPEDAFKVRQSPVISISYIPNSRLEEDVFLKRFGEPAQRISETENGLVHWLYPQHGLDIVLGEKNKPMLQYVSPKDFELLRAPLLNQGKTVN
ncbi:MAG: hypothetical protein ACOY3V_02570 [Pseudomonadota bacterium]